MALHRFFRLSLPGLLFLSLSCVKIPLQIDKVEKYETVRFEALPQEYKKISAEDVDGGWIHSKNGSVISYKTECKQSKLSAKKTLSLIFNELDNAKLVSESSLRIDKRPALAREIKAQVDGVPSFFNLVAFEKHGCLFLLALNGFEEGYASSKSDFQSFVSSFRAPNR